MSGAGCHNMGNLPMLPVPGELNTSPNDMMGFSPEIQIQEAHAGYYDANLFKQINCQLTVTERTGLARIIFNEAEKGTIVIGTGINSTEISEANVKITGPNSFEGVADGGNFCGANSKYNIYFVGEFSKPASTFGSWKKDVLQESKTETEGVIPGSILLSIKETSQFYTKSGFPMFRSIMQSSIWRRRIRAGTLKKFEDRQKKNGTIYLV